MYAKMSQAISARHRVREQEDLHYSGKGARYTKRVILWNIGILKIRFAHVNVHMYIQKRI